MEPKTLTDRELFWSIVPGWRLVQKIKDKQFERHTREKEFRAKISKVVSEYGIQKFVPEYSRPYFIMAVCEGEFRRLIKQYKPREIIVTDWVHNDEGVRGGFHFHADVDIVISSNGYVLAHGHAGVLSELPYVEVERKSERWQYWGSWVKYNRTEP
ncbi:MAG: hypothetical protein KW793_04665 [Candidatus Doudnabacteria bacterium]|nr:hypothetical protein [Candidatus Doudnabacteria bacterium]